MPDIYPPQITLCKSCQFYPGPGVQLLEGRGRLCLDGQVCWCRLNDQTFEFELVSDQAICKRFIPINVNPLIRRVSRYKRNPVI